MISWFKDFVALTLIIGVFFGATVGRYPLAAPDGARYAEIPREMVATGDYITPRLNGIKYFEKPPLFYWLQATSIKIFGVNEFAVSLVNALMAFGSVLWIYSISRKLYGRKTAWLSSFIFATSSLVFVLTRIVTLDMSLTFFLTGSLGSFLLATQLPPGTKRTLNLWTMYILAACAVMTKGLVGIVFLGTIVMVWLTVYGEWHNLKTYHIFSGSFIFLLIALPWHILVQLKNPEFFRFYFFEQHFLRYFTEYADRTQKWWFLPITTLAGLYPWTIFLPQAIIYNFPKHWHELRQSQTTIFLFLWIVIIYIFYTFSNSKLIPYILPMFTPTAILLGNFFAAHWQSFETRSINIGFYTLLILNIILVIGAFAATFILDFNEQAITKQNLYLASIIMILNTVVTITTYHKHGTATGCITLIIATAALWLYFSPIMTTINKQSIKPLITILQQKLTPDNEVICYGAYYQELPFYLQRIVTVVDYHGELSFGIRHQDASAWIIDPKTFWERWQSNRITYLITDEANYRNLLSFAPDKMRIIAKLRGRVLVVNTK
ncbi:MAG: glycosyltransferase family 39 protein [Coxiellaceae bacterium]|jgi:4-amino-4-deoxy-L-arabinose transferase-like glycosyltransferase|nr:glycosyltransferase family 39 protein [Coxiellaceae bacterium]